MMNSLFRTVDDAPGHSHTRSGRNPLLVLWEQRLVFFSVFAAIFLSAIAAIYLLPHRYYTAGSLIVAEPESGLSLPPPGWAQKVGDPADIESQLVVIKSPRLMRLVLETPGIIDTIRAECAQSRNFFTKLWSTISCHELTAANPSSVEYLQSKYSIGGAGRSRVISIGYTSSQPQMAQTMANALVNAFLKDHREGLSDGRGLAMAGLSEEMEKLDREIRSDDARVQAFRGSRGLTNGATAPITSERLSSISAQLALAESSRSQAASIIAAANNGGAEAAATVPAVLENRAVADVKQRISAAAEQAAAAAISLGPRHPRLQAMQGQVNALQSNLRREVANVVDGARRQFDAAERTVASLKAEMEAAKVDAANASRDETSIEQMVRETSVKRGQYASLFDQRKKLESEQKALLGSTRLVSLAEYPDRRYFPKTKPFVAGGFALGLIGGCAAALFCGIYLARKDDDEPRPYQRSLLNYQTAKEA